MALIALTDHPRSLCTITCLVTSLVTTSLTGTTHLVKSVPLIFFPIIPLLISVFFFSAILLQMIALPVVPAVIHLIQLRFSTNVISRHFNKTKISHFYTELHSQSTAIQSNHINRLRVIHPSWILAQKLSSQVNSCLCEDLPNRNSNLNERHSVYIIFKRLNFPIRQVFLQERS